MKSPDAKFLERLRAVTIHMPTLTTEYACEVKGDRVMKQFRVEHFAVEGMPTQVRSYVDGIIVDVHEEAAP